MANWKETSATAWDGIEFKVGTPGSNNAMASTLVKIGNIKDLSLETEDGKKREWEDINGKIIDELSQEGKLKIKLQVKNLNKSVLERFWDIEEDTSTGHLKVKKMSSSEKLSTQILNTVRGAETFSAPYCSTSAKPTYSKEDGYMLDIEFTILDPGNGKELFVIGQTA
ncbi:hypothetical protein [Capnocytophaga cynodegmi]|uniref:hypothetical protein n=1 Tax=Capnocytophaga cynodegmi TaxID=28189 RepID=UPI001EE2D19F|nr:hypothetical protein [Capnocytophaga cynodegmi]GJQ07531.1 hypothetical protein CAPN010_16890 [Capnocytophaga cynodegmi]